MFKAIFIEEKGHPARITELPDDALRHGDVAVDVLWSTLNYKDGLALTGRSPVVRAFPMIPGIDLAGTVTASADPRFHPGDAVVLNGAGLGELHFGGLAQRARVAGDGLVRIPAPFDARDAAAVGTAGFTAMLSVLALERHGLVPQHGEVLVTGAAGGVGSVAIALLARRGFSVVASTGRTAEAPYLEGLGAARVIDRAELAAPGKPLGPERYAAVVDSVGSHTLANACAQTKTGGAVAACGLAQGMDFPATVAPFILRGVALYGIDSVHAPRALREQAWARLAADLDTAKLASMTREIGLGDAIAVAAELLEGKVRGRVVVDVNRG